MATKIKIGHASISEDNAANGRQAGDQTGREVWINPNFSITDLNPNVVLRPNSSALAEKSAKACEAGCENAHIGYSQNRRNSLNNLASEVGYNLSAIKNNCDTDCSAFMTVCAIAGGSKISYGSNAPTTSNMRTRFKQSGDYTVLTDSKHLKMTDYLKRGDILVHEGSHTVMVLENGSNVSDADLEDTGSTGITPITNIRVRYIDLVLSSSSATNALFNIRLIEQKTGSKNKLLSASALQKYKYSYTIETITKSSNSALAKRKQFTPTASKSELSVTDLKPETAYTLQVFATNKDSGNKEFCSQKVVFVTPAAKTPIVSRDQEFIGKTLDTIDHIYIKIDNTFTPAIIYK